MPLASLFNTLGPSLREAEHLLSTQRTRYAALQSRHESFISRTPQRTSRLNHLARLTTDLVARKDACRRRIELEQTMLKEHEAARARIASELEGLRLQVAEAQDVRDEMARLQREIVAVDAELQEFRLLARKIQRRASTRAALTAAAAVAAAAVAAAAHVGPRTVVVDDTRIEAKAVGRVCRASSCVTGVEGDGQGPFGATSSPSSSSSSSSSQHPYQTLTSPNQARRVNFVVEIPLNRPASPEVSRQQRQLQGDRKRPRTLRRCVLIPSVEVD